MHLTDYDFVNKTNGCSISWILKGTSKPLRLMVCRFIGLHTQHYGVSGLKNVFIIFLASVKFYVDEF